MKFRERRERKFGTCTVVMIIVSMMMMGTVVGQTYEKNSKITKTFYATEETDIQISNKYGNIHLIPWEKDSVRFEIDLSVRAGKEQKVDRLFDNVDFDFTSTRYNVIARTVFQKNRVISDMTSQLFSGDNNIVIDYIINIPQHCNVTIENKFGNIYSTDHYGNFNITLSNGDLKVNDIHNDAKIDVEFGNTFINSIKSGKLNINYGDLELGNAGELILETKSATLNIDRIDNITINSRRDKFYIDTVGTFKGDMSFSYINIKELGQEMILTSKYGDINVESVSDEFSLLNTTSEFTDIKLFFSSEMFYDLEIFHDSKTSIKVPEEIAVERELIDKNTDKHRTYGTAGEGGGDLPMVKISIKAGYVSIIRN